MIWCIFICVSEMENAAVKHLHAATAAAAAAVVLVGNSSILTLCLCHQKTKNIRCFSLFVLLRERSRRRQLNLQFYYWLHFLYICQLLQTTNKQHVQFMSFFSESHIISNHQIKLATAAAAATNACRVYWFFVFCGTPRKPKIYCTIICSSETLCITFHTMLAENGKNLQCWEEK